MKTWQDDQKLLISKAPETETRFRGMLICGIQLIAGTHLYWHL